MENLFIAEGAKIVGDVEIGLGSSIWFNAVVRGDISPISIGKYSNIQDNCTLHVSKNFPCQIGNYVTIGHNAVVHGAYIEDNVLVGMGACILNGAKIASNTIIAAKALVTENMVIPENSLVVGIPGKIIRTLSQDEILSIRKNAENYVDLANSYK